ncbi:hypothetical protein GCM10025868_15700 [Angustibacter aerolatus]|uniref:Fe/B12 periplasmic-binding domain-containing protein n=1 Tax=Angustibacter aerolatus TaxID=1162965 RepID=A0ABQ6JHK5_9ACTN|nr:hypothetical protein [Angustibacter aerolatus]GMA86320.1 hypothetical protein GCM10025868_15700 [Angustibacter aerolatus]
MTNDYFAKLENDDFYGTLSAEQADVLDADVLVFFGEPEDTKESILQRVPSMGTVPAFKEDRTVLVTDLEDSMAFSAASVLSIPLALDAIVPEAKRITA